MNSASCSSFICADICCYFLLIRRGCIAQTGMAVCCGAPPLGCRVAWCCTVLLGYECGILTCIFVILYSAIMQSHIPATHLHAYGTDSCDF